MSSPATPQSDGSNQQSKQMSSRLLTMKFMQRSSASNRTSYQAQTPNSEPPPKRRRTGDFPDSSSPMTPTSESKSYISRFGVGAAFKMRPALEDILSHRVETNDTGETQWVLNIPYIAARIPKEEEEEEEEVGDINDHDDWAETNGRQCYGSFKKKKTTNGTDPGNGLSVRGVQNRYELISSGDIDSEGNGSEDGNSDAENGADISKSLRQDGHRAPTMDYTDERTLAALDEVDLSKSSYAKSKGAFVPHGRLFSAGKYEKSSQESTGKFTNKDKTRKNTKHKRK